MNKMTKKGFTIVELVIVIAVIAILAAVLIPTFSNLVSKANQNAAMQAARNEYEAYLVEYAKDLDGTSHLVIVTEKYEFEVVNGQFKEEAKDLGTITKVDGAVDLSVKYVVDNTNGTYYYSNGVYSTTGTGDKYKAATPAEDIGSADVQIYAAN